MKLNLLTRLLITAIVAVSSLLPALAGTDVRIPENRVIYEVFVRNFSPEGTLRGVEAQIPRLKALGVDVVWLMPIYSPGLTDRWGTYASPYCVKDYKAIDPDYGTDADLRSLVTAIHANGMEIWLDWVANHTSTDNAWITSHPEYYVWENGSIKHPYGWNDVYQLNFDNAGMRDAMIDALKYWVREFDIDGYRCDYASGPGKAFWAQARAEVNQIKDIAWLAEDGGDGSNAELVRDVFDYNYAWGFSDNVRAIGSSNNASRLAELCNDLVNGDNARAYYGGKSRMVYLTNHDVVQDKGGSEEKALGDNLKPMTVMMFTVYGMPLIYNGQEVQYQCDNIMLSEKTPIDWNTGRSDITDLITRLAHIKHTEPALRTSSQSGALVNHTADNAGVYVYERRPAAGVDGHSVVVMLNLNSSPATFNVTSTLPADGWYQDAFSTSKVAFSATRSFTLPARGYAVYTYADDQSGDIVTPPVTPTRYVYVNDNSGWDNLYIYSYTNGTPNIETFGTWPGTQHSGTVEEDGVTYKQFTIPAGTTGSHYIILNKGTGGIGNQTAGGDPFVNLGDGDVYLTVSGTKLTVGKDQVVDPPVTDSYYVYIVDNTGWGRTLHLYAWANGQPEIFGSWPGAAPENTVNQRSGTVYAFSIPESAVGKTYNLIINNGGKDGDDWKAQLPDVTETLDHDIYLTATDYGTTAIDVISATDDDSPLEYYDLHGRRVHHPSGGIFIERRGSSVRKVAR